MNTASAESEHKDEGGKKSSQLVPFAPGFLTEPLYPLEQVLLRGCQCLSCGITLFGIRYACENCCSRELKDITFSRRGKIYSYTRANFPPPPPYEGQTDPFVPYTIAWVDLPEGVRLISTLVDCNFDSVKIGLDVELVIVRGWTDAEGNGVISYAFKQIEAQNNR